MDEIQSLLEVNWFIDWLMDWSMLKVRQSI